MPNDLFQDELYNPELQEYLTQTALKNGALVVGYTKVRRTQPVMVLAFPYSNAWILNHPFYINRRFAEVLWHERKVHEKLAARLEEEGYRFKVKSSISIFGDFRPLAIAAGIGKWGKNGLVVNPTYGSKLVFSALFTNAPFEATDHSGLAVHDPSISSTLAPSDACKDCNLCIQSCPGNAFVHGVFNPRKCFLKSIRGCSECIQVCTGKRHSDSEITLWT